MMSVQQVQGQAALPIQEAWENAVREENRAQYPNRELATHTNWWFRGVNNWNWQPWISDNTRAAVIMAAKLPSSDSVAAFGETTYGTLGPDELISLYRILNSHNVAGNKDLMIERGNLAKTLVESLEKYITKDIAERNPVHAQQLSQILANFDESANVGHILPKLTQSIETYTRHQQEIADAQFAALLAEQFAREEAEEQARIASSSRNAGAPNPAPIAADDNRASSSRQAPQAAQLVQAKAEQPYSGVGSHYSARVGASNPGYRKCSFNSMAQYLAHSGPNAQVDQILSQTRIGVPLSENELQYVQWSPDWQVCVAIRDLPALDLELANLQRTLADLNAQKEQALNEFVANHAKFDRDAMIQRSVIEMHLPEHPVITSDCSKCARIERLQTMNPLLKVEALTRAIETLQTEKIVPLETKINDAREVARKKVIEITQEKEEKRLRALNYLAILRGEKQGKMGGNEDLSHTEDLYQTVQDLAGYETTVFNGYRPYRSPREVEEDQGYTRLKEAFQDPNWVVIRAGGNGHFWAYVRNQDGKTIDEVNDSYIRRNIPISELQNRFSSANEWKSFDITFYPPPAYAANDAFHIITNNSN